MHPFFLNLHVDTITVHTSHTAPCKVGSTVCTDSIRPFRCVPFSFCLLSLTSHSPSIALECHFPLKCQMLPPHSNIECHHLCKHQTSPPSQMLPPPRTSPLPPLGIAATQMLPPPLEPHHHSNVCLPPLYFTITQMLPPPLSNFATAQTLPPPLKLRCCSNFHLPPLNFAVAQTSPPPPLRLCHHSNITSPPLNLCHCSNVAPPSNFTALWKVATLPPLSPPCSILVCITLES